MQVYQILDTSVCFDLCLPCWAQISHLASLSDSPYLAEQNLARSSFSSSLLLCCCLINLLRQPSPSTTWGKAYRLFLLTVFTISYRTYYRCIYFAIQPVYLRHLCLQFVIFIFFCLLLLYVYVFVLVYFVYLVTVFPFISQSTSIYVYDFRRTDI